MAGIPRHLWTDDQEAELLALWKSNLTIEDIAAEMGLSESAVQTRCSRLGFGRRKMSEVIKVMADGRMYWSEADIEKLMEMRLRGVKTDKIAEHFGRTPSAFNNQISKINREGIRERAAIKMRPCMRCKTVFGSEGAGNRHCEPLSRSPKFAGLVRRNSRHQIYAAKLNS